VDGVYSREEEEDEECAEDDDTKDYPSSPSIPSTVATIIVVVVAVGAPGHDVSVCLGSVVIVKEVIEISQDQDMMTVLRVHQERGRQRVYQRAEEGAVGRWGITYSYRFTRSSAMVFESARGNYVFDLVCLDNYADCRFGGEKTKERRQTRSLEMMTTRV
jgi:hypothetical protein